MEETARQSALRDKRVRVGIVVVNYNSGAYLKKCVTSILQSRTPADIVIVDNDSSDNSLDPLSGMDVGVHSLTVIRNEKNLGFARAVNRGVLELGNRFVLFLNPDCTIFPGTLLKFQKVMMSGRDIAIAGALDLAGKVEGNVESGQVVERSQRGLAGAVADGLHLGEVVVVAA